MRQVEYIGFGWVAVEITDSHLKLKRAALGGLGGIIYDLAPELKKWLKEHKSGGYYSIQTSQDIRIIVGEKICSVYPSAISFSRKNDAMMFMWQCL